MDYNKFVRILPAVRPSGSEVDSREAYAASRKIVKILHDDYFPANIGVDTAENEPSKVRYKGLLPYNYTTWIPSPQAMLTGERQSEAPGADESSGQQHGLIRY